jgi:hypothetical protein
MDVRNELMLFSGVGQIQTLTVEQLYQGILDNVKNVTRPTEYTDCVQEYTKSKPYILQIKRNWLELQRRAIITFPLHYGPPNNIRVMENTEYLYQSIQCKMCLKEIQYNESFYINTDNYTKFGTQECAFCTKNKPNQVMKSTIYSDMCRIILNTIHMVGSIVSDKMYKLSLLKREYLMVNSSI